MYIVTPQAVVDRLLVLWVSMHCWC